MTVQDALRALLPILCSSTFSTQQIHSLVRILTASEYACPWRIGTYTEFGVWNKPRQWYCQL